MNQLLLDYLPILILADVAAAVAGERALPERALLVTLDDGLTCQFTQALPVLDALKIPAAFFALGCPYGDGRAASVHKLHFLRATEGDAAVLAVATEMAVAGEIAHHPDAVDTDRAREHYRYDDEAAARLKYFLNYFIDAADNERVIATLFDRFGIDEAAFVADFYMTPEMLRALAERGWLGSHAWTHRPLATLDPVDADTELRRSRDLLRDLTGNPIDAVSYPLGNPGAVGRPVANLARGAGYAVGWTMERASNLSTSDPLLFARLDAADIPKMDTFPVRSRYFADQ